MKERMKQAFDKAALTYDDYGFVQQEIASLLSLRLKTLGLSSGRGLEIGCGTGFLSEQIVHDHARINWTLTDISDAMLNTCRSKIGPHARYHIMDGEYPDLDERFDIIVSNLAFQWFSDLPGCLRRLKNHLNLGGTLYFTTLGNGSFEQWRTHLDRYGQSHGLHRYPEFEELGDYGLSVERVTCDMVYENGLEFVRSLKSIGAQTPRGTHKPIGAGRFREILNSFMPAQACPISYEIYFCQLKQA